MSLKSVKIPGVGMRNVKTALAAAFCAFIYYFFDRSPAFACIGAIFGMGSDMGLANAVADTDVAAELKAMDYVEVEDAFYRDLAFGTGGLRGVIGGNYYSLQDL